MDGWFPGYTAPCTYDTLWDEIPPPRSKDAPPGRPSPRPGGQQGYFWPVSHDFVSKPLSVTPNDFEERSPTGILAVPSNPTAEHTQFPQRLQEAAETTNAANWGDLVSHPIRKRNATRIVVFWFSEMMPVFASGLLWSEFYEADEDPITGSRTQVDVVDLNYAQRPLLKDARGRPRTWRSPCH